MYSKGIYTLRSNAGHGSSKKYQNEDERGADGDNVIDDLRESFAKLGPIRPALVTKFGVAAGETRKKANPAWPKQVVNVKSFYDHLRLRAADNIHARKPVVWWAALLGEAGEELMKSGVKPGRITERLMQDFPLAERTILAYLPRKYKSTARVRAGSLGGFAASNAAGAAATTALNDTTAKTVAEGPTSESGQERDHSDRPRHRKESIPRKVDQPCQSRDTQSSSREPAGTDQKGDVRYCRCQTRCG